MIRDIIIIIIIVYYYYVREMVSDRGARYEQKNSAQLFESRLALIQD